jgi:hypothetical protein
MGRFWSADPAKGSEAGDPGSWNKYAYVQGDPENFYDPAGLSMADPDGGLSGPCGLNWTNDGSPVGPCSAIGGGSVDIGRIQSQFGGYMQGVNDAISDANGSSGTHLRHFVRRWGDSHTH